jgi:hypothetical protein
MGQVFARKREIALSYENQYLGKLSFKIPLDGGSGRGQGSIFTCLGCFCHLFCNRIPDEDCEEWIRSYGQPGGVSLCQKHLREVKERVAAREERRRALEESSRIVQEAEQSQSRQRTLPREIGPNEVLERRNDAVSAESIDKLDIQAKLSIFMLILLVFLVIFW